VQAVIKVAVRPFIKKYLAGLNYATDPFVLSTTNKYGLFVYHCLEKPRLKVLDEIEEHPLDKRIYSDVLRITVSEKYWEERGPIMSVQSEWHFNKFVLQDFNDEFYNYVRNRIGPKGTINKAIRSFLDMYDISEDDLSFKTIQRAFQRRNAAVKTAKSA
jgi:hypothetical protein